MNLEYDKSSKQYRRNKEQEVKEQGESAASDGGIYQTSSSAEHRRSTSRHRPWHHSRKKWKAVFWVFFTVGLLLWAVFMVYMFKDGGGAKQEDRPSSPMGSLKDILPQ